MGAFGLPPHGETGDPVPLKCRAPRSIFQGRPEFLTQFRHGDPTALADVYSHYLAKVASFVRRLAVPDSEMADVVQEVFLRAFAPPARMGFDGVRDYGSYLYGIARRTVADRKRKKARDPVIVAEISESMAAPDDY
jgi:DNA-directed RNA polymerase specialized sigma24 family protein